MSKQPDIESVRSAFELLSEQLQVAKSQIHDCTVRATEEGEYDGARILMNKSDALDGIKLQVESLSKEFAKAFPPNDYPPLPPPMSPDWLVLKKKNCNAKAKIQSGSVIVLADSLIELKEYDSLSDVIRERRSNLQRSGNLTRHSSQNSFVLNKDCKFKSPSAAACFVLGYSANGKIEWKFESTGKSLGESLNVQKK